MSNMYVYSICSRNKDNKDVPGFKPRSKTILEFRENESNINKEFRDFASKGIPREKTRLYRSVNSRNENRVREEFIIRLLRDKPSVTKFSNTLASVASQVCNRDESKWLFDFDYNDEKLLSNFTRDVCNYSDFALYEIETYKTPNGYAVVVEHGFDTRKLMGKWDNVALKKDAMLFLDMIQKEI